jgi:hypothetical protein
MAKPVVTIGVTLALLVGSACDGATNDNSPTGTGGAGADSGSASGGLSVTASGGAGNSGGSQSTQDAGGSSAADASNCATRSEIYSAGVQFVYKYQSVIGYPDCVPTCGVPQDSVAALPAGSCTTEPTCARLAFWDCPRFCSSPEADSAVPVPDSGSLGANGFICACVSGRWSCTIAQ